MYKDMKDKNLCEKMNRNEQKKKKTRFQKYHKFMI